MLEKFKKLDAKYIIIVVTIVAMGVATYLNNILALLFIGFCGNLLVLNLHNPCNTPLKNQEETPKPKKPRKIKKVVEILVDEDGNEIK